MEQSVALEAAPGEIAVRDVGREQEMQARRARTRVSSELLVRLPHSADDVRFEYDVEDGDDGDGGDAVPDQLLQRAPTTGRRIVGVCLAFAPKTPEQLVFEIMQRVVASIDGLKDADVRDLFYIKGGYVRDKLRGHAFNDMDMYVRNIRDRPMFTLFVRELVKENRLVKFEKRYGPGGGRTDHTVLRGDKGVKVGFCESSKGNVIVHMDAGVSRGIVRLDIQLQVDANEDCDFTCNNLVLDAKGCISTRIKHGDCKNNSAQLMSESDWLATCIRDVIEGRLVVMVRLSASWTVIDELTKNRAIINRIDHMTSLAKGYNYACETISGWLPRLPVDRKERLQDDATCVICQETIKDYGEYLPVKCGHPLHLSCAMRWIRTGRTNGKKCPVCRADLQVEYGEPYTGAEDTTKPGKAQGCSASDFGAGRGAGRVVDAHVSHSRA